jgi:hypothetical protein
MGEYMSQTVNFLRTFNRWRRGDETIQQPCPRVVGQMIDRACEEIEQLNESNTVLLADLRHYREEAGK